MSKITEIVTNIVIMIIMTFLYLMAKIKDISVPVSISIIYGTVMIVEIILAIRNAIQLDIRLNK